ncbi:MAG: chromate transporter [Candidatus Shapirobacteria bacterium]|jgi:hypothetical protein
MTNETNITPPSPPKSFGDFMGQLDAFLTEYLLHKAPALPQGFKEFIVKYGPYIDLVMIVLMAPVILAILGISAIALPFSFLGGGVSFLGIISMVLSTFILVLEIIALPGLFKRQLKSWKLLYYVALLGLLNSLLSFQLVGGLVSAAITLYFLYQIKSYYT